MRERWRIDGGKDGGRESEDVDDKGYVSLTILNCGLDYQEVVDCVLPRIAHWMLVD